MSLLVNSRNLNIILILCLIQIGCVSCVDNATKLAGQLETASNSLQFKPKGTEYTINYRPVYRWVKPYVIVLIPGREITLSELTQKGLDYDVGYEIFSSLGYIDVGYGDSLLIIYQDGDITFTSYFRQFVKFSDIHVIKSSGSHKIVVKKIDNSKSRKVNILIEETSP